MTIEEKLELLCAAAASFAPMNHPGGVTIEYYTHAGSPPHGILPGQRVYEVRTTTDGEPGLGATLAAAVDNHLTAAAVVVQEVANRQRARASVTLGEADRLDDLARKLVLGAP